MEVVDVEVVIDVVVLDCVVVVEVVVETFSVVTDDVTRSVVVVVIMLLEVDCIIDVGKFEILVSNLVVSIGKMVVVEVLDDVVLSIVCMVVETETMVVVFGGFWVDVDVLFMVVDGTVMPFCVVEIEVELSNWIVVVSDEFGDNDVTSVAISTVEFEIWIGVFVEFRFKFVVELPNWIGDVVVAIDELKNEIVVVVEIEELVECIDELVSE